METTKSYTRRDSATSVLRKLGYKPVDYNKFISSDGDKFVLTLPSVKPAAKKATGKKAVIKNQTNVKIGGTQNCSTVARELILSGKSNLEVWTVIQKEFDLDEKKRGYPAWYRWQLRQAGHKVD